MGTGQTLIVEQQGLTQSQINNASQEISLIYTFGVVFIVILFFYGLFRKEPVRKENNNA